MATVIVKYKEHIRDWVMANSKDIELQIVNVSAQILRRNPGDILVEITPYGIVNDSTPDLFLRGETSRVNAHLLDSWARLLIESINPKNTMNIKIAVKTTAIESCWVCNESTRS